LEVRRNLAPFLDLCEDGRLVDSVVSHARVDALGTPDRIFALSLHRFGDERPMARKAVAFIHLATVETHRLIVGGQICLPPSTQQAVLSSRLQQVLNLLLGGAAPKEIARELGISVHTVRDHIKHIYVQYNVSGRGELAALFMGGPPNPSSTVPQANPPLSASSQRRSTQCASGTSEGESAVT